MNDTKRDNSKIICIIPARSGSKRIKNKNILKIDGIPMIGRVIKILKKTNIFCKIIVTTDSIRIAKIAKKFGAEVPFVRNKKLSNSKAIIKDVIINTIKKINSHDYFIHYVVYPTAILIEQHDIINSYKLLKKNIKANMILPVVQNSSFYRSLIKEKNKENIKWKWKKFSKTNSQNLDLAFNDSGTFFAFKTKFFLNSKDVLCNPVIPYIIDKYKGVDVNTIDDLNFLKIAHKMKFFLNKFK